MAHSRPEWRRSHSVANSNCQTSSSRNLAESSARPNRQNGSSHLPFQAAATPANAGPDPPPNRTGLSAHQEGVEAHILQDETEDDLCQVVMAVDVKERGTVGCCYYVAEEEKFYVLEDIVSGGLEVIETCMHLVTSTCWNFALI